MSREYWKPVKGFPGYEISRMGNVRFQGEPRKACLVSGGLSIQLKRNGAPFTKRVARLVGEAFSPRYKPHLYPIYKDGNPRNCNNGNIEWVHRSYFILNRNKRSALEEKS